MATARTIIGQALRLLRVVYNPGQTASSVEEAEGLIVLNNLLDSWSTERLLIPYVGFTRYTLVAATASYTIGPSGGTLTGPRPIRIDAAGIVQLAYNAGSGDFREALEVIPEKDWVAIKDKTATADIPKKLYYAPTIASNLGTIYLWPIPNVSSATSLELSAWIALVSFADQTTDVPLAPGYQRALIYNLALELKSSMRGPELPLTEVQEIGRSAVESKEYIRQLNSLMVPTDPDLAIPPVTNVEFAPVPSVTTRGA